MSVPGAGLCNLCLHQRVVRSGRGSLFSMCRRAATDDAYMKYPPIPVLECRGFEEGDGSARDDASRG